MNSEKKIEVRDLEFRYRKSDFCLNLPSFDVGDAETVAVIGPSGAGKTTLLNMLAGCDVPDSGVIKVAGQTVSSLDDAARRDFRIRHMGLVFQEFELLDYLSVLDNILLPYRITPELVLDSGAKERAAALASDAGIADKLRRPADCLSQGERQRVAVCRALVTEPTILLCDEPTGNLDPDNTQKVLAMLLGYAQKHSATLVSVTHEHELLPRFSRVIDFHDLLSDTRHLTPDT